MNNNIEFYMVPSSPWSFLSFNRIEKIAKLYNLKINLIPIDIFQLFEVNGIKKISQRSTSIQKNRLNELQRWRDHLNIDFNIKPKFFPVNPIKSCRAIIATSIIYDNEESVILKLARALSEAVWVKDLNIDDNDVILKILEENVVINKIKNLYLSNETSNILKENTIKAAEQNVFGVPSFVYNESLFWGQDRISFLEKEIIKLNV